MDVQPEEVRRELERLASSEVLAASESQRRLLLYLAEKSLRGEADGLKEYTVGIEGFAKPEDYDPRRDSIVRLQAGRLRQRIAEYYQNGGQSDPVIIDFPKGGFKLVFRRRLEASSVELRTEIERLRRLRWVAFAGLAALFVWASVATFGWVRNRSEAPQAVWTAEMRDLWNPVLSSPRPLLVSIGTPLFIRVSNTVLLRNANLNDWTDIAKPDPVLDPLRNLSPFGLSPWYNFTGVGEAMGAFHLAKLLGTQRADILLTRSSMLSWDQVADANVIFLGPPKFNPQLKQLPVTPEFEMEAKGIRVVHPAAGEPDFLKDQFTPGQARDGVTHALISHFPGLHGNGDILVFAGNAGADTLTAVQWLTVPDHVREVAAHLRGAGAGVPRYYQFLLRTEIKNYVPVKTEYVAHRALSVK